MNNKLRALNVIRGLQTDRPSVLPSIDVAWAPVCSGRTIGECFVNTQLHAQCLEAALDMHPEVDGLYVNLCLDDSKCVLQEDGLYNDGGGLQWFVPRDGIGTVKKYEIMELSDIRLRQDTPLKRGILDTFSKIGSSYKENYLIIPGITGPYSQVVFMLGLENVLYLMYDEPEELKKVIAGRVGFTVQWLDELIQAGAEAVWLGEGAASSSLISPSFYSEFVAPFAGEIVQAAKRRNIPCFMHVCGDIRPSIDEITKLGIQAIDIDYMVPMPFAREHTGPNVCLKGNINPVELMSCNENEVFQKALTVLDESSGPVILGTGCLVAPGTPHENIDALVRASKFYAEKAGAL